MAPLIAIQILGLVYKHKQGRVQQVELPSEEEAEVLLNETPSVVELPLSDDDDIIEL